MNMRKRPGKRAARARAAKMPLNKRIKAVAKQVFNTRVETKTWNPPSGNITAYYGAQSGLTLLCADVFAMPQGVQNSTATSAVNRIGDKVRAIGFKMCYDFSLPTTYSVGTSIISLGYCKFRILAFTIAPNVPVPAYPLVYDVNFTPGSTYTNQPIAWGEGYVKKVVYDKTFCLKAQQNSNVGAGQIPWNNVMQFRKYVKFDRILKYMDESPTPDQSSQRVFIALTAEYDTPSTVTPSGTKILHINGYTQAWFKDA